MAYDYKKLEAKAVAVIKEKKLYFIEHIVPYLPCSKSTFYDLRLHDSDDIKDAIELNKISKKNKQLSKWADSDNPTLQLAHYKLIATDEERKKLSQTYTDVTTDGEKLPENNAVGGDIINLFLTEVKKNVDEQARSSQ